MASERSFTRGAARLGVSTSALSHSVRLLEERLGLRLLSRTTRAVAPTEAGLRLLEALVPALDAIDASLIRLGEHGDAVSGPLRITASRHGYETVLQPLLAPFLQAYPLVQLEVAIEDGFTDIVSQGFDAGLRLGSLIERDLVAVRAGPPVRFAVVAAPAYLTGRVPPRKPQDLGSHTCIGYRTTSRGDLHLWPFERNGQRQIVRPRGDLVLNDGDAIRHAAIEGLGLACLFLDQVEEALTTGQLVQLLTDWCPVQDGYHLYHSSRRQSPPALRALVEVMRTGQTGCVPSSLPL